MSATASTRTKEGGLFRRLRAWREQHIHSLVSSLGRFFQRPIATLLTVGVMAVAIALPLGLALALANVERLSGSVRESREVSAFLKLDVDAERAQSLADELARRSDVAVVTVKTPAQGLEEFRRMSELAGALELLDGNPLPTVLVVQPRDDGAAVAQALRNKPEVDLVQHDAVWRQRLSAWLDLGERLLWVVGSLLGLGVLLVVGNTIRLEFGARREEIAVMQQLGATDGFIRRPFIYLGLWYGVAAGALATLLLVGAVAALQPALAALTRSYGSPFLLRGADASGVLAILLAGALLGWAGAWLASGHHLRQTRPTDL
jgi:cell division transport system permease protein